jgi:hypothetical protein
VLHVDGYAGFERLTSKEGVVLAACWAHTRHKFYEMSESTGSPIAAEALRRIGELYAVEARRRGQPPRMRLERWLKVPAMPNLADLLSLANRAA